MFNIFQSSSSRASRGVANKRYACVRAYECLERIKLSGKHFSICAAFFAELLGENWQDGKHPSINAFSSLRLNLESKGAPPHWDFACRFVVGWLYQQACLYEKNESVKIVNPESATWGGDGNRELLSFEYRTLEPSHPLYKGEQQSALSLKKKVDEVGGIDEFAKTIEYTPRV